MIKIICNGCGKDLMAEGIWYTLDISENIKNRFLSNFNHTDNYAIGHIDLCTDCKCELTDHLKFGLDKSIKNNADT